MLKSVTKCCAGKACKPCLFENVANDDVRTWTRKADIIDQKGVRAFKTVMLAPYPGDVIVDTEKYYTFTFKTEAEFIQSIVPTEIGYAF